MNKNKDDKFKSKELDEKDINAVSGGMVVESGLVTKDQRLDQVTLDRKHRFEDNEEIRKNIGFVVDKTVSVVDAGLRVAAASQGIIIPPTGTATGSKTVNPLSPVEAPGSGKVEAPKVAVKSPLDEFLN